MKKILSLMLALAMLVSMVAVASAEDAAATTAPAFQTNVAVDVPAMATAPTFDGVINADEWGTALVSVKPENATTQLTTAYNKENTFVWWNSDYDNRANTYADSTAYDIYFGWDATYLYVAAEILDENGYYVGSGRDGMWEFDVWQMYIDIYGANGIQANNDETYDYTKTGFDWFEYERPWSNAKVANIVAGKVTDGGRNTYQLFNDADKAMVASRKEDGTLNPATVYDTNGDVYIVPSEGGEGATTVIEMAVPWEVIAYDHKDAIVNEDGTSKVIGVGKEIGISTMYQNVNGDEGSFGDGETAELMWGSGIVGLQYGGPDANRQNSESTPAEIATRNGGSNALILTNKGIDGAEVTGLPTLVAGDTVFEERVLYLESGTEDYYGQTVNTVKDEFTASIDLAMLDYNINDPAYTAFGFLFGVDHYTEEEIAAMAAEEGVTVDEYKEDHDVEDDWAVYAGFDFGTSKATISQWGIAEGMTTTDEDEIEGFVYAQSDTVTDWKVGGYDDEGNARQAEWKTLTVSFKDHTTTVSVDGEVLVTYTDETIDIAEENVIIIYGTAERLYDNFTYTSGDKTYSYTFDSTDNAWNYGKDQEGLASADLAAFVCNDAENVNLFGYTGHNIKDYKKPNSEMAGCLYCTDEDFPPIDDGGDDYILGDANGDGRVNIMDAIFIAQATVSGTLGDLGPAADYNEDTRINIMDAIAIAQMIVAG